LEFLKRSFRFENLSSRFVAPLRLDVVLEVPYWTKKNSSIRDDIVHSNVQCSLDELSLHGRQVFDQYAPKICAAYQALYGKTVARFCFNSCYAFIGECEECYIH